MSKVVHQNFLESSKMLFAHYKRLGEKTFEQVDEAAIQWKPNEVSNSIALLVHHLSGNMISRFTDFLSSDGEKPWRNRDLEFEQSYPDKKSMLVAWEKGWTCVMSAMDSLSPDDLNKEVYIRNEGHTVLEVIQRQLTHYATHVGQIMAIAKWIVGDRWKSLTIPKGETNQFNAEKFSREKTRKHFTEGSK